MARGRKPKPIEVRDAEGNPGRRPLPEPLRTSPLPMEPPRALGEAGAELWRDLVDALGAVGALDRVDRIALTAMCLQWDRATAAALVLKKQGHYARGSMGQMVAHPALGIERAAHTMLLKFASEYAATPVARARVAIARAQRNQERELEEIIEMDAVEVDDAGELDSTTDLAELSEPDDGG